MTARQACGVDFPFVTATSICLSTVTICSGLYLSIGILYALLHEILSHFGWYKISARSNRGHGRDYWQAIGCIMPDYERRREELRGRGIGLAW